MSDGERPVYEQRGLWYEELEVGALYRHAPGRTVSEADNILFSTLTMNPQALAPRRSVGGATALRSAPRQQASSRCRRSWPLGRAVDPGTIVANLGFSDVVFPKPVFHGDTLYAETVVVEKRLSASRPGTGVVTFEHTARNQHGEVVAVAKRATMVFTRPE